jgi:hypothetical protein
LSRLEDQKTLILAYWKIMMSFMGCKKFPSIILVSKNYLTMSTHDFQPWLLTSLMILILKPWQCKQHSDWIKWKEAIETELGSLRKQEVFSNVISTPPRTYPVGFKWGFIRKQNENNEVVRYKARLVAQGFT